MDEAKLPGGTISVADALRLEHHFNRQVTYGNTGLDALAASELLKTARWVPPGLPDRRRSTSDRAESR